LSKFWEASAHVYAKLGEEEKSERVLADFKRVHSQEMDEAAVVEGVCQE
jgi:hypothetical protein